MYGITEILNSGKVGQEYKQLREQRELITEKWNQFGLLDGLEGHMAENIAQLYENQASYLINESTDATSSGSFETVAFPIIRRVFQKLLANEIVSVQAMNMPIGRLYFINPKISVRVNNAHTTFDGVYSNAAGFYNDSNVKTGGTTYQTTSLYDSFYNSGSNLDDDGGLFDRTKGRIIATTQGLTIISGSALSGGSLASQRILVRMSGFSTTNEGKLQGPVGMPIDTETFLMGLKIFSTSRLTSTVSGSNGAYDIAAGDSIPFRIPMQAYGKELVQKGTNYLQLEILLDTPNAANSVTGIYGLPSYVAGTSNITGTSTGASVNFFASFRTYTSMEEDANIPQITFTFDFIDVSVEKRMLGATFTPELQQDVNAFHSIDVEAELTALLSEVVSGEIDREILRDLRKSASHVEFFDYGAYDRRLGSTSGNLGITRKDYNQELITKINQISARIMKYTLRGGANWVVCSPEIAALFNDLEYFHASDASAEETKFSLGIEKVGSVANRYSVYVDAYAPAGVVLVGHKGDSIFHAGYIYAPYVPLMLMPKTINPADFKPVMGIMTRYAKKVVNNRFYGKVLVQNLPTVGPNEFLLDSIS
jgi:hypothetical protein